MNKHRGDDHVCRTHFHIVDIDPTTESVVLQYLENEWLRGTDQTRRLSWVEFLNGLKEGRFEIHRSN